MAHLNFLQSRLAAGARSAILLTSLAVLAAVVACSSGDGSGNGNGATSTPGQTAVAGSTSTPRPGASASATPLSTARPGGPTATPGPNSTSTPRPSPTATPIPPNAIAVAGNDIDTKIGNFIGLNGSGSSDPDGDPLTFKWTQVNGPDVTGGVGWFTGPTPSFAVPLSVSTLVFELRVDDGDIESYPDTVQINVFEHVGNPGKFVDGNSGSDETGDGTRENPFASISYAISRISGPDQDIHVMSMLDGSAYEEETTLAPPTTTSLYGGYGPGWVRDVVKNKTRISGASTAVRFRVVDEPAWFSGFEVVGADATSPGESAFALRADAGGATFIIEDNILRAGNAGDGTADVSAGSSYGLFAGALFNVVVRRNEVTAGNGGNGATGVKGQDGKIAEAAGARGKDGSDGGTGGAGGKGGSSAINGGRGGNGGGGILPEDGSAGTGGGGGGGNGGNGDPVGEGTVGDGKGGSGGGGGNGGKGGLGSGSFSTDGLFIPGNGDNGTAAANGGGGGGGGGGAGGAGLTGGGGGGGGGGGTGGAGGGRGNGGGASIGIMLNAPVSSTVQDNMVTAGNGGNGGNGGVAGVGGAGKAGGVGGTFQCAAGIIGGCNTGRSGDGGEGGGGGSGGIGGQGGGGAGGPSYGIVVGKGLSPAIIDTTVNAGKGGNAGSGGGAGLGGTPGGNGGSSGGAGGCCLFVAETAGAAGSGGDGGWSFAVYDMDPSDERSPALTRAELKPGQPGVGRSINGKQGESGEINS